MPSMGDVIPGGGGKSTPDQRARWRAEYAARSPERKAADNAKLKSKREVRTPAQKAAKAAYMKQWNAKRSPEFLANKRRQNREYMANATPERKRERESRRLEVLAAKSIEEREVIRLKKAARRVVLASERTPEWSAEHNETNRQKRLARPASARIRDAAKSRIIHSRLRCEHDDGTMTLAAVMAMWAAAEICPDCGVVLTEKNKCMDHIVSATRHGWHSIYNVRVGCFSCNSKKRTSYPDEWVREVVETRGLEQAILCRRSMLKDGQLGRGEVPAVDVVQLMEAV